MSVVLLQAFRGLKKGRNHVLTAVWVQEWGWCLLILFLPSLCTIHGRHLLFSSQYILSFLCLHGTDLCTLMMLSMWDAAAHAAQESTRSCLWIFQLLCSATIPLLSNTYSHTVYTVHENLNVTEFRELGTTLIFLSVWLYCLLTVCWLDGEVRKNRVNEWVYSHPNEKSAEA